MQYTLDILGKRFRLSVPFELQISQSLAPFLRPAHGEGGQFQIIVQPGFPPQPGQDSVWHDTCYYDYIPGYLRILRCQSRGSVPYVMVELNTAGNIRVTYRPEYVFFIKNASDLMQCIGLERLLLCHGGMILHASFIAKEGKGILFSAPSGTGKSTQAKLWRNTRDYEILNGDRAGLCKANDGWLAWGLPYAGTSGIFRNESAKLVAVVVLRQGRENSVSKISCAAAIRYLYPEVTIHHWAEHYVTAVLDLLQELAEDVPVFLLECLPDEAAVLLLEQTLEKEGVL